MRRTRRSDSRWCTGCTGSMATRPPARLSCSNPAEAAGKAPEMIVVLVNGMVDSFYNASPDGKWPVESVIIKELIPHIDKTYRTIASREGRAIEGYSMGGYGAAHLGFKYPAVF